MKSSLLGSFFLIFLADIAWADTCPSGYTLTGSQCCYTQPSCSPAALTCSTPPTTTCVAPTPTPPVPPALSTSSVKFVPIQMDDGTMVIIPAEQNIPKDPGTAGNTTVAGVITNVYGVRDDVMRGIVYAYPNNPQAQTALFNMALNYQTILVNSGTSATIIGNMATAGAWGGCLQTTTGDSDVEGDLLRPLVLNTYDRSIAYITALQTVQGTVTYPKVSVTCP